MARTALIAPEQRVDLLRRELTRAGATVEADHGRLLVARDVAGWPAWAHNVWHEPEALPVPSVKRAAKQLRARQRNWVCLPTHYPRRSKLIARQLPHVAAKPLRLGELPPAAPLGGWTLLDDGWMLAAAETASAFPNGEPAFVEDREGPPNRAYLKLCEAFATAGRWPRPGERCLDLGAAPGGWTWVLAQLGAEVLAVDKAELAPRVADLAGVTVRRDSAFGLRPHHVGPVDWLVADIACTPARLHTLVDHWLAAGTVRNFICTLKFQGETDFAAQDAFAALPGTRLTHLYHNKHELTWISLAPGDAAATRE